MKKKCQKNRPDYPTDALNNSCLASLGLSQFARGLNHRMAFTDWSTKKSTRRRWKSRSVYGSSLGYNFRRHQMRTHFSLQYQGLYSISTLYSRVSKLMFSGYKYFGVMVVSSRVVSRATNSNFPTNQFWR